jgi:hypothetical protein
VKTQLIYSIYWIQLYVSDWIDEELIQSKTCNQSQQKVQVSCVLTDDLSSSFIVTIKTMALAFFDISKIIFVGHLLWNQNDDQKYYIQALMQLQERGLKIYL